MNPISKYKIGPLYLEAMNQQGVITESTFSFFMRPVGQISFVNFGPPQLTNVRESSVNDIFYFDVNEDFYWSTFTEGIALDDPRLTSENTFGFQDQEEYPLERGYQVYTIFDTGTSEIMITRIYFMSLIE